MMSCRCRLGCQWNPCLCFRTGQTCSPKCLCINCANGKLKQQTLLDLPGFTLISSASFSSSASSASSSSSTSSLPPPSLIPEGNLILKQWRGFVSHHGWRLFWLLRLLTKLSCCFGHSEEYNSKLAWFLCQEIVATYAYQPTHPVCRLILTSITNRLLCHLFEEGAGIFEPARVVLFNKVDTKLTQLREKLEKSPLLPTDTEILDLLYCLVSMVMLTFAASKKANLVDCYRLVLDDRAKTLTLLGRSEDEADQTLLEELQQFYPSKRSNSDPIYQPILTGLQRIEEQQSTKVGWMAVIHASCGPLNCIIPGFSAAMQRLIEPWYYKRDRIVFNYAAVLTGLISQTGRSESMPDFSHSQSLFDMYIGVSQFILRSLKDTGSSLSLEMQNLINVIETARQKSIDWAQFVTNEGPAIPAEVTDRSASEKETIPMVVSMVPEQDRFLNPSQQVLLRCYQRCLFLKNVIPVLEKRERGEQNSLSF